MDSLCHPCITATHLSYSVLSLTFSPPPCAVLLVFGHVFGHCVLVTLGGFQADLCGQVRWSAVSWLQGSGKLARHTRAVPTAVPRLTNWRILTPKCNLRRSLTETARGHGGFGSTGVSQVLASDFQSLWRCLSVNNASGCAKAGPDLRRNLLEKTYFVHWKSYWNLLKTIENYSETLTVCDTQSCDVENCDSGWWCFVADTGDCTGVCWRVNLQSRAGVLVLYSLVWTCLCHLVPLSWQAVQFASGHPSWGIMAVSSLCSRGHQTSRFSAESAWICFAHFSMANLLGTWSWCLLWSQATWVPWAAVNLPGISIGSWCAGLFDFGISEIMGTSESRQESAENHLPLLIFSKLAFLEFFAEVVVCACLFLAST